MEVVTTGAIRIAKLQSNCQHQQTNIQFFTGRKSFLSPNQQCQMCPHCLPGLPGIRLQIW